MTKTFIHIILVLVAVVLLSACMNNGPDLDKVQLNTHMDTISYLIGLDYGIGISDEKIEANRLALYKGVADGLDGKSIIPDSLKNKLIEEFNTELDKKKEADKQKFLAKNKEDGKKFMKENLKKEGVMELPDHLQYKVLKEGTGAMPSANDSVLIHYRAMFIDRTVFDMSYDRGPAGIRLNSVIKGLSEGIQLMRVGSIYEFYIPPELAYGDKTFAKVIPPGTTLIYSVELIKIIHE